VDVLSQLNPAQKEAVETINGPLLILAGPGSGKTRVITHRVAYLIRVCGISPYRILAVTFTNKAAKEMTERLNRLVSGSVSTLTLGTFHAICARILRRDGKDIGVDPSFVIYDEDDQMSLVKRCVQSLGLDPKQFVPRAILSAISTAKSSVITPQEFMAGSRSYFEEVTRRVYELYQEQLNASKALDFDDLLMKTVLLFKNCPGILAKYQERYLHIMVDEFQDTNLVQYELVKQLAGKYRNICVVGDPDQSIYSWRSADLRNILNFEKDYPDAKIVYLEQNYRSTQKILETASHVIQANRQRKPKNLWTENEPGDLTAVIETYTEQEEAQYVVKEIEQLVDKGGTKLGDCAIMYRTNAQSRVIEEAFIRYGVPYKLVAGTRFYERREIKDVIAYLRLVQNPYDTVSLLRVINVPGRGIGQQSIDKLSEWAKNLGIPLSEALQRLSSKNETTPPPLSPRAIKMMADFAGLINELVEKSKELNLVDLFDLVVNRSGYKNYTLGEQDGDERWENILELRTVAAQFVELSTVEGLTALLEGVTLVSDVDGLQETVDAVTLITLHQAKGLEFPVVFIVGVEEGLLPHFRSMDDPTQMEEERRLCYVGITRAQRRIYLTRAFRRSLMGRSAVNKPSRFLQDIPPELISSGDVWQARESKIGEVYSWDRASDTPPAAPLPELKAGDHVRHAQFGEGIVVSSKAIGKDCEVAVTFVNIGIKKLMLSFAKLEKTGA
jgi:DNA helicase II / ATP-dependent DNA helicase PcrA